MGTDHQPGKGNFSTGRKNGHSEVPVIMKVIEKIIGNIRDLPTLPTVYLALSDVMADPRSTAQDISQIVSSDPASSSRVLRSLMYHKTTKVSGGIHTTNRQELAHLCK